MKKFFVLFLSFFLMLPEIGHAFEYTFEGKTLKYTILDMESKTCKVDRNRNAEGDIKIPSTANDGEVEYLVTSIGTNAFYGCSGLTSVSIPNSVTSIGDYAFFSCSQLSSLSLGNAVTSIGDNAFHNCSLLTSVDIPESVTSIGGQAFASCTGLTSVILPESVISIGYGAFESCKGLTSMIIPNSVTSIGSNAFSGCTGLTSVNLGESVTSIGNYAFDFCTGITSVTIPGSVKSLGDRAFYGCIGLKEISLADGDLNLEFGEYVFNGVRLLESLYLGRNYTCTATDTEGQPFYWKSYLTSLTIGKSVTSIGDNAFINCGSLKEVTIVDGDTNLEFGSSVFTGSNSIQTLYVGRNFTCAATNKDDLPFYAKGFITSLTIGDYVSTISPYAFSRCSSLTSVCIPNSVTSIGDYAFADSYSIKEITLADGYTNLEFGDNVLKSVNQLDTLYLGRNFTCTSSNTEDLPFFNKYHLTSLTIGNSVTTIGDNAFKDCSSLKEITLVDGFTNLEFGLSVFSGVPLETLYVGRNFTYTASYTNECPFCHKSSLTSLTIGDSVTDICPYAFYDCNGLMLVNLGKSVCYIGKRAFKGCTGMDSMTLPNTVTSVDDEAFASCYGLKEISIPNSVASIGDYAFADCIGLKEIKLADSDADLEFGSCVFNGVHQLETLYVGRNFTCRATSIGDYPFYNKRFLTSLTIGGLATAIGSNAFNYCTGLKTVNIGKSITKIGHFAFDRCSGMTSIEIPNWVTSIGDGAFSHCSSLTSVDIPNSVSSIRPNTFNYCSSLTSINIPTSVDYIGDYAFQGCSKLTSGSIPSSVTSIGDYAFRYCSSLTSVNIPSSVNFIGDYAFQGCNGLGEVYYDCKEPISGNSNIFDDSEYQKATLFVPSEAIEKCKTFNPWRNFRKIEAYVSNGVEKIATDIDVELPYVVYDLNGVKVSENLDNIAPGIYIIRQGNKVKKIVVN